MTSLQAEQPLNLLRIDGRQCRVFNSTEQYHAIEAMDGMLAWNGQQDNMIDRFDGRALLDFYKEPDARMRNRAKTEDEIELEEVRMHATSGGWLVAPSLKCWLGASARHACGEVVSSPRQLLDEE